MLNSLKGMTEVEGNRVIVMDDLREQYPDMFNESGAMDYKWFETDIRPHHKIYIRHDVDSVSCTMMTKPASEGGKGCQWTVFIRIGLRMLKYLNAKFPCRENAISITKLEEALMWQEKRTMDRIKRNVEGKNEI
jgi:hypothetical protein